MGAFSKLAAFVSCCAALFVAMSGAAPIGSSPTVDSDAADQPALVRSAIAAFRQGDVATALARLRQAHKQHAELPPAEVMLANFYFSNEQPAQGRKVLEQAAVEHPADPEPHLIFGDLARLEGRLSDAEVQYERGGNLTASFSGSPKRRHALKVRALAGLAHVAEARKQYEKAHKWLTALLSVEPEHANAHYRLGNVLFQLGRREEAFDSFRRAAEHAESAPLPRLTMAELYQQAGERETAEKWLQRAIEESPDNLRAQLAMAWWQLEQHHALDVAARHVAIAAELNPKSSEVRLLRGLIAWCREDLAAAEKEFEAILLTEPGHAAARNYLAAVLVEQDDPVRTQRAAELVQLAVGGRRADAQSEATAGWVALHQGDLDQAYAQLRSAAAVGGGGRDTSYYLARVQFRRGEIAAAQQTLRQAHSAEGLFVHRDAARRWQRELQASPAN